MKISITIIFKGILFVIVALLHLQMNGQYHWDYPGPTNGFNGDVRAAAVFNGKLYVGGNFTLVDGTTPANRIACYDGTSWAAVGSGLDNNVRLLYVYNAELYVGGYFTTAGGVSAVRIAKYDGTTWSTVGTGVGMSGVPYAMATYGGNLYVGGEFGSVDGLTVNRIAKWDGSAWSTVGNTGVGMNGAVYALGVYGGNLYCGGSFSYADYVCCPTGVACGKLAIWDGVNFSAPGTGITGSYVYKDMAVYNGELYVPGLFSAMNGVAANNIAKYDGTTWTALGSDVAGGGANAEVNPLVEFNSELYVGGDFTSVNGMFASKVAKWNGTAWSLVSTDTLNSFVTTLTVYDDGVHGAHIFAGGKFTLKGVGKAVNKMAILPVEWLYFNALHNVDEVRIEWATASETNNNYFTLERSGDGILFDGIATITGAGTSSKRINYYTSDKNPLAGISYYRLKQTDFDGKFTYSEIVSVNVENTQSADFSIYPNPVNISDGSSFSITLAGLQRESTALVVLYDVFGKQCVSKRVQTDSHGSINFTFEIGASLNRGVYMIRATSGNKQFSKKVMIG
ncbi:MAG: T9SS type A sorting domain-containing protein [Bacteroidetes bacterium]|nr:T9SS type A sorting domain-containing protein [Bacteroidota bacterium]